MVPSVKSMALIMTVDELALPINHCLEEYDPKYDCFESYSSTFD